MQDEELLFELEDLLRNMPAYDSSHHTTAENLSWYGRATAALDVWSPGKSVPMKFAIDDIFGRDARKGYRDISILVHQAIADLRMKLTGPNSIALSSGQVFDYFDEIRKIIESATQEIFFVDPYLDADFVSTYLPHVKLGVPVKLLAREKLNTLIPAVEAFSKQSTIKIEVRSAKKFHDRYIFIDRCECHQSGASFKDGAKKSPTTVTQITDAFDAVLNTYDKMWGSAQSVYK